MMLSPYALRRFSLFSLLPLLFALLLAACSTGRDTSARDGEESAPLGAAPPEAERPALPPAPPLAMGATDEVGTTATMSEVAFASSEDVRTTSAGYSGGGGEAKVSRKVATSGIVSDRIAATRRESAPSTTAAPRDGGRAGAVGKTAAATASVSGHSIRGARATDASARVSGRDRFDAPAPTMDSKEGGEMLRDGADIDEEPAPAPPPVQRSGQLTAGEWSDLRDWNFWNGLMADEWGKMRGYWKLGSGTRITVQAHDGERPVIDAAVQLYGRDRRLLWSARTDNHGVAELYTGLADADPSTSFEVVVKSGDEERRITEVKAGASTVQARFRSPSREEGMVDVMFAIDATGSMGDELEYIKAELENVVERVRDHAAQSYGVRVAANVYRDVTDDYVVRPYPFTQKMDDLVTFLRRQSAGGGGDTPEAVETALADAIDAHEWSPSARARLLFLVLDAPPHHTDDRLDSIAALVRRASERGIHVIPVASSGVDKETEFLLRMLAIHTGGTYVFLTDHSGIGNSHTKPTTGDYKVEFLNDLIVRLIIQYGERYDSMGAVQPRIPAIR